MVATRAYIYSGVMCNQTSIWYGRYGIDNFSAYIILAFYDNLDLGEGDDINDQVC